MLESLGCAVVTATTLTGALAACAARSFDLVVVGRSVPSSMKHALINHLQRKGGPAALCLREEDDPQLFSTLRELETTPKTAL